MQHFNPTVLRLCTFALAITLFAACKPQGPAEQHGIRLVDLDTSANPRQDFFRYANGGWLDSTEIPADQGNWGSFNELRERNNKMTRTVVEEALGGKYTKDSDQYKAGLYYKVAMDSTLANKLGAAPLKPYTDHVAAVTDLVSLRKEVEYLHMRGMAVFFSPFIYQDAKNNEKIILNISEAGLGMPNRDYYLDQNERFQGYRTAYLALIEKQFTLAGFTSEDAKKAATTVLAFETSLAKEQYTPAEARDAVRTYNKRGIKELSGEMKNFDLTAYVNGIGAGALDSVILDHPTYYKAVDKALKATPVADLKTYLTWHVILSSAPYLSQDFIDANFEFFGKTLRGQKQNQDRWKRSLASTNGIAGEAIGKLYVDKYFPAEAKQAAEDMISNIRAAFKDRIDALEWMTPATKAEAQKKLSSFRVKIGYPNKWREYTDLKVGEESYLENAMNGALFQHAYQIAKIGKPVDKEEWFMSPQTVNAYYNPIVNEIVFPAAILQYPFFDYKADAAVNYGGMGAVIGHEMTHGFDDQGREYDDRGLLRNWWTEEDGKQFMERAGKVVAQYNQYEPVEGVFVNGQLTLGENIADLGGVTLAYAGLQRLYKEKGQPKPIDGYTGEQRFFLSWATIWRTKAREESLVTQVKTDSHSPGRYRAIGPLRNFPPFYEAFKVEMTDPMAMPDSLRAIIW